MITQWKMTPERRRKKKDSVRTILEAAETRFVTLV
jgi:hypothetical protein